MLSACITGCITFRAAMRPARKVMHFPWPAGKRARPPWSADRTPGQRGSR